MVKHNMVLFLPFSPKGAETLGYSGMAHGMFPKGGVELVNHFYTTCNNKLEENLAAKAKEIENNPEL